jgi:hypothetical protein
VVNHNRRSTKHAKPAKQAQAKMVRRNVTFSARHATLLDQERERSGVATSTLLRQLIEQHFGKAGGCWDHARR